MHISYQTVGYLSNTDIIEVDIEKNYINAKKIHRRNKFFCGGFFIIIKYILLFFAALAMAHMRE